ncbi:proline-rich protein 2-like [Lepus europaeus]|uniref:proline-rich protein 2-like n=1 Tax=Lepus europaeus TaxID=9983 RepID=UPI002B4A6B85|nr:proline-rich protein 2-like [Lepus europaeus]
MNVRLVSQVLTSNSQLKVLNIADNNLLSTSLVLPSSGFRELRKVGVPPSHSPSLRRPSSSVPSPPPPIAREGTDLSANRPRPQDPRLAQPARPPPPAGLEPGARATGFGKQRRCLRGAVLAPWGPAGATQGFPRTLMSYNRRRRKQGRLQPLPTQRRAAPGEKQLFPTAGGRRRRAPQVQPRPIAGVRPAPSPAGRRPPARGGREQRGLGAPSSALVSQPPRREGRTPSQSRAEPRAGPCRAPPAAHLRARTLATPTLPTLYPRHLISQKGPSTSERAPLAPRQDHPSPIRLLPPDDPENLDRDRQGGREEKAGSSLPGCQRLRKPRAPRPRPPPAARPRRAAALAPRLAFGPKRR